MAQAEQKINSPFPNDESLQSWAVNQVWVIKNTPVSANDTVPLPAARVGYALQRLAELIGTKTKPEPVEFENRGNTPARKIPPAPKDKSIAPALKKHKEMKAAAPKKSAGFGSQKPSDPIKPAKVALTPVEKKTLAAIKTLIDDGTVPTYRGIAAAIGAKGHGGVHDTVNRLVDYGMVIMVGNAGRQKIGLPE